MRQGSICALPGKHEIRRIEVNFCVQLFWQRRLHSQIMCAYYPAVNVHFSANCSEYFPYYYVLCTYIKEHLPTDRMRFSNVPGCRSTLFFVRGDTKSRRSNRSNRSAGRHQN